MFATKSRFAEFSSTIQSMATETKSNETKAKMAASRIVRVLRTRPESEYDAVYAEQLARRNARDHVLNVLESVDEDPLGVEPAVG